MARPSFVIDVRRVDLQRSAALERDLQSGGLFVPGARHALNEQCEVRFRFADLEHSVAARVVFSDGAGVGLELSMVGDERLALVERLRWQRTQPALPDEAPDEAPDEVPHETAELVAPAPMASSAGAGNDDDDGADRDPAAPRRAPLHERVRNLSVAEQLKLAHQGEQQERILLERLYGKTVWEALLRNPRLTAPEVARIARMGALPKPLLEIIVGNGAWLQVPEVRRALLGNPRLAPEQIVRVLRLLPKHELKLVPAQLAYPAAVRDVARRLLRDS